MKHNVHKTGPDLILAQLDRRLSMNEPVQPGPSLVAGVILVVVFYGLIVLVFVL